MEKVLPSLTRAGLGSASTGPRAVLPPAGDSWSRRGALQAVPPPGGRERGGVSTPPTVPGWELPGAPLASGQSAGGGLARGPSIRHWGKGAGARAGAPATPATSPFAPAHSYGNNFRCLTPTPGSPPCGNNQGLVEAGLSHRPRPALRLAVCAAPRPLAQLILQTPRPYSGL